MIFRNRNSEPDDDFETIQSDVDERAAPHENSASSLKRHGMITLAMIAVFAGTIAASSMTFKIDGAVIAQGFLAVEQHVKKVQHPAGGVVRTLHVKEGQTVEAGALLLELDDTIARANLGIIANEIASLQARLARLYTERDEGKSVDFPAALVENAKSNPEVARILAGELSVFKSRATTLTGQKQQLNERIGQLRDEIRGAQDQLTSVRNQTTLAKSELRDLKKLLRQGLVPRSRVSQIEREVIRNEGMSGELLARVAQAQGRISETELQIIQLDRDTTTEVTKEIRESEIRIAELLERRTAAEDQLRRIEIRAPIAGSVLQLNVHTVGGVVGPGEVMMQIVPKADRLIVDARIMPMDVDRVHVGQETHVMLSGLNAHTTPRLNGTVTRVGADLVRDPQTQQPYFSTAITIPESELHKITGVTLVPGMPADGYIRTGERTIGSYLMKPVLDQFQRALREE